MVTTPEANLTIEVIDQLTQLVDLKRKLRFPFTSVSTPCSPLAAVAASLLVWPPRHRYDRTRLARLLAGSRGGVKLCGA